MKVKIIGLLGFALLLVSQGLLATTSWRQLAPGLEYSQLSNFPSYPSGSIHAFRLDPARYTLQSAVLDNASIQNVMQEHDAVIAVNGGYFSPEIKPMGLRMSEGRTLSKLRPISWWGVFYLRNSQPNLVAPKDFQASSNINFAVQAGPRLVVDGEIPKLAAGMADRSALGITRNGKIIVLATENLLLSTKELAEIMRASETDNGLNCYKALNLDGGHSTQLYTNLSNFNLQRSNVSQVADLVLVVAKSK